jgi:hypothetical protein
VSDHGFNASPVWITIARLAVPSGPVGEQVLKALALIDVLFLIVLWGIVFIVFSPAQLAMAAVFWGTNGLGTFEWTGGAFMRHDWLLAAVAAVAALRTGRWRTAGALVAYATSLRVFPALIAVGVLIATAYRPQWFEVRRRFFPALAATAVLLVAVSSYSCGISAWTDFSANLRKHVDTRAGNLVGLPHVVDNVVQCRLAGYGKGGDFCTPPERAGENAFGAVKTLASILAAALYCVWLRRISKRLSPDSSAVLAMGILPLATSAACYYYEVFLVFGLLPFELWTSLALLALSAMLEVVTVAVSPPNKIYLVATILVVQFVAILPVLLWERKTAR